MSDLRTVRLRSGVETVNGITGETGPVFSEYVLLSDYQALQRDLAAERERADRLIAFLADDALAMTYQSLAQYRQAAIDSARRK